MGGIITEYPEDFCVYCGGEIWYGDPVMAIYDGYGRTDDYKKVYHSGCWVKFFKESETKEEK